MTQPALLALMVKHMDSKGKQAKLKSPAELQARGVGVVCRRVGVAWGEGWQCGPRRSLGTPPAAPRHPTDPVLSPPQDLLDVTRTLLAELEAAPARPRPPVPPPVPGGARAATPPPPAAPPTLLPLDADADELREKFRLVRTVLEQGGSFAGVNRKAQLKPLAWGPPPPGGGPAPPTEALLILKHGGVLTHAGRAQAEALGSLFRTAMYPRYGDRRGTGGLGGRALVGRWPAARRPACGPTAPSANLQRAHLPNLFQARRAGGCCACIRRTATTSRSIPATRGASKRRPPRSRRACWTWRERP